MPLPPTAWSIAILLPLVLHLTAMASNGWLNW